MEAEPNRQQARPNRQRSITMSSVALERKLVTIRRITHIRRPWSLRFKCLVVVTVSGGLNVVTRQGKLNVGDHVLFFEVDSFIPAAAVKFGWLMRHRLKVLDGEKGFHVELRAFGKQLSQGYIMAIEEHALALRIVNIMKEEYGSEEGIRVASMMAFEDVIGVKKWAARDEPSTD